MADKQPVVAAAGFGLVLSNYWLGGARQQVSSTVFNPKATADQVTVAHSTIKNLFIELFFVIIATIVAGISDGAADAMLAVIVALAILWAINHYAG